jgi:serine/threonine-protein kinase
LSATVDRLTAALADRYRIERELGAGGMATVYLAYDLKHDRKVALKVLKPELAAVIGAERFLAEIKTTANYHPTSSLFTRTVDGTVFYVMPFVDGSRSATGSRGRSAPIDDAVRR